MPRLQCSVGPSGRGAGLAIMAAVWGGSIKAGSKAPLHFPPRLPAAELSPRQSRNGREEARTGIPAKPSKTLATTRLHWRARTLLYLV